MSKEEITGLEKTAHLYIGLPKSDYPFIEIAEKDTPEGREMYDKFIIETLDHEKDYSNKRINMIRCLQKVSPQLQKDLI